MREGVHPRYPEVEGRSGGGGKTRPRHMSGVHQIPSVRDLGWKQGGPDDLRANMGGIQGLKVGAGCA